MPHVTVGNLKLFCTIEGEGPPVLLISGLGGSLLGWTQTQVPALTAAGYRCIAIDNRDVGRSDESPGTPYTTRDMAQDAAVLLRALGVPRAHVVGWSMGGMIAQELALTYPELVQSLVLYSTDPGQSPLMHAWLHAMMLVRPRCSVEEFARVMMPWLFGPRFLATPGAQEGFLEAVRNDPFPQHAPAYLRQCNAILAHDTLARLHTLRVPTLVIAGTHDLLSPPSRQRLLTEAVPGARLVALAHSGHAAAWEEQDAFNRELLAFLGERAPLRSYA